MARVLIVDDEAAVRNLVEQTMIRCGHNVLTAVDGFDALKKISLGRIDLVITDVVMPEMDGVKLIGHIRERYPRVQVLAISGGGPKHTPKDCLKNALHAGAAKALLKPFSLAELCATVNELLGDPPVNPFAADDD